MAKEKAAKKKRPASTKGKEVQYLPGQEPKKHPKIHAAAVAYADVRDQRQKLTDEEHEAKMILITRMKDEGITDYVYGDVDVHLNSTDNVKVRIGKTEPEGDKDGEAAE